MRDSRKAVSVEIVRARGQPKGKNWEVFPDPASRRLLYSECLACSDVSALADKLHAAILTVVAGRGDRPQLN